MKSVDDVQRRSGVCYLFGEHRVAAWLGNLVPSQNVVTLVRPRTFAA